MKKDEFLSELRSLLTGLDEEDIDRSVEYYGEMIDERVESGMDESAAIAEIGIPRMVADSVISATPMGKLLISKFNKKKKEKPKIASVLILTSPVWITALIVIIALLIAFYAVLGSIVAAVFTASLAFAASAPAGLIGAVMMFVSGSVPAGIFLIGAATASAGLAVLSFVLGVYTAKLFVYIVVLTRKCIIVRGMRK